MEEDPLPEFTRHSARGCFLCGQEVGGSETIEEDGAASWMRVFRLVYLHPDGEARVSGMARRDWEQYEDEIYSAPEKYEDLGSSSGPHDVVAFIQPTSNDSNPPLPWLTMSAEHNNFPIHGACWALLEKLYRPLPVPTRRVWDVLMSMATYGPGLPSWGHEYVLEQLVQPCYPQYPWRPRDIYGRLPPRGDEDASPHRVAREFASLAAPPDPPGAECVFQSSADPKDDIFFRLPSEIRLEIAILLSVKDALHGLRRASKAFSFLFHDQLFWASRFRSLHGERSWLLGAERKVSRKITTAKGGMDWRRLFRQTRDVELGPGLSNLRRIWGLAQKLRVVLDLEFCGGSEATAPWQGKVSWAEPIAESCIQADRTKELNAIQWRDEVEHPSVELEDLETWQKMHSRVVYLPDDVDRLSFSFVMVGRERYLAGIMFHSRATGEILRLGYKNPSEPPEAVDIKGEFCGFELAVGSRGICQLSCKDSDKSAVADWVGGVPFPSFDCPITTRLVCRAGTKILAMKAKFDGLRIIKLSLASEHTVRRWSKEYPYEFDGGFDLWNHGIWHSNEDEDAQDLQIWDDYTLHAGRLCQGYKPLTWVNFGGQVGISLKQITKVSVLLHGKYSPRQFTIMFTYGNDAVDGNKRRVMLSTRAIDHPELEEPFEDFLIDGPGGEFITNIGMINYFSDGYVHSTDLRRDFEQNGFPVGIEVKTNQGRSKAFTIKSHIVRSGPPETFFLAPPDNEVPIMGLYAGEIGQGLGFQLGVFGLDVTDTDVTPDLV
ncbi:hypothetical protein QBC39DRAFT_351306 [Podospora conica]|nr:hypothetical protein QBC39DRAFT_351306 [Schizothecium conicum]